MAKKYVTLHLIPVVRRDPKTKTVRRKNIQPNSVVEDFTADEIARLTKLGAIKEYTPGENKPKTESSKGDDNGGSNEGGSGSGETRTREELEARAKELELSFPSNIGDAKLAEKVAAAEAEHDGL